MKRLAVILAAVAGLLPVTAAARPQPEWISNCTAKVYDYSRFSAICKSGNASYVARAYCYNKFGGSTRHAWPSVMPGTTSRGSCPRGYIAKNPGWTQ